MPVCSLKVIRFPLLKFKNRNNRNCPGTTRKWTAFLYKKTNVMVTPGQIYYYLAAYLSYFPLLVCGTDAKTNRDWKPVCSNRCGFCRKSLPAALLQKCFYGVLHEGLEQKTAHPFSTRRKKTLLTTAKYLFFFLFRWSVLIWTVYKISAVVSREPCCSRRGAYHPSFHLYCSDHTEIYCHSVDKFWPGADRGTQREYSSKPL